MSASASTRPVVDTGSPEWRAALFAQAIAYAAHLTGPICPHALGRYLWNFVGKAEEECGGECLDAVLMLIRTGLFTASTAEEDGSITFGGETKLTVTPMLTAYLYGGPDTLDDDEN